MRLPPHGNAPERFHRRTHPGLTPWIILAALGSAAGSAPALELDTAAGRWSLGGYAEGYGIVKTDSRSPRQRPEAIVDLSVTGTPVTAVRLQLETRFLAGGPPENADGFGVFNFHEVFQNLSPSITFPEAYLDLFLPHVDLRLGLQKFTWGRLDTFHPADVVSPREYHDPFLTDEQDAKIGMPAISAGVFPPDGFLQWAEQSSLTLIWVPVPVPFRFPLQDERWFPPAASVPATLEIPAGTLGPLFPAAFIRTDFRTANTPANQRLSQGTGAARMSGSSRGVDWSLYFYSGRETAPAFDLTTAVRLASRPVPPITQLPLEGTATLKPRFGRIWLTGADAAFQLAGITARAEAVYGSGRLVPRSTAALLSLDNIASAVGDDLGSILDQLLMGETVAVDLGNLFERRDVVEWGLGADYPYRGWVPVLQVNQAVVLDNTTSLLVPNVDTRLFGALRKTFLSDRLDAEIIGVQGLERSYTTVITRLSLGIFDGLRVRVGYLLIAGSRNSLAGQFKANDEVFLQIRYSH